MEGNCRSNASGGGESADRNELRVALRRALNGKVLMYDKGKKRKVTKLKAILTYLVTRAASGNKRALDKLMTLLLSPSFAEVALRKLTPQEVDSQLRQVFGLPPV